MQYCSVDLYQPSQKAFVPPLSAIHPYPSPPNMTRYFKPTFPAHDNAWDDRDEFEPPSLSRPTDKLLSEHPSPSMDLESASSEKSISAERRRCCTRLSIDWSAIFVFVLAYTVAFLLTLALSLAHFFVGARILKYPTDTLQYRYTQTTHYVGGTTVIRQGLGVTAPFMHALAAGTAVMALVLCVATGFALVVLVSTRWEGTIKFWVYWAITMGSTVVAAIVAGLGVVLHPVDGLSIGHAFSAGGVGFAVLVVPLALFFALVAIGVDFD